MAAWQGLLDALPTVPTLDQLGEVWRRAEARLSHLLDPEGEVGPPGRWPRREWCHQLAVTLSCAAAAAGILISIDGLSWRAEAYVQEMTFRFFDTRREVFHIG
jgi:ferric-dicitrate binding protein FerR (iron transport regulator)